VELDLSQKSQGTQNSMNNGSSVSGVTRNIGQVTLDNVGHAFNRRRLNTYTTTNRRKTQSRNLSSVELLNQYQDNTCQPSDCRVELDSHAHTCGVNNVARVLEFHGQVAEVSGFADTMESLKDIPIVKAALAYDDTHSGETAILIINQALYFGTHLSHMLFNPNQLCTNGIVVNDIPTHLSSKSSHSILVEEESFQIPLKLSGIISYYQV